MDRDHDLTILTEGFKKLGICCDERAAERFLIYHEMLAEWNEKVNLTSITGFENVVLRHFIDSASVVKVFPGFKDQKVIDIGTGAGFPGLPLKILFPALKLTLADSVNKKLEFVREVVKRLELSDVETVHQRAEDLGRDQRYRQKYDICVSRAVSNLSTLSEYCLPLVKINGVFISYKSADCGPEKEDALRAISLLGAKAEKDVTFTLPGSDIGRRLILIKKIKDTPRAYPRKAGTPAKKPL